MDVSGAGKEGSPQSPRHLCCVSMCGAWPPQPPLHLNSQVSMAGSERMAWVAGPGNLAAYAHEHASSAQHGTIRRFDIVRNGSRT